MEANKVALNRKHEHVYNQLTLFFEVFDKVSLTAEPTLQFTSIMATLFSAHKLVLLLLKIVHSIIIDSKRIFY